MKQKGWLIYQKEDALVNMEYIDWFIEEARLQKLSLKLILREELTIGITNGQPMIKFQDKQIDHPNFAIVRTVEPLLNTHLENCKIKTFNSSIVSRVCNHKYSTHLEMSRLHVPMVETLFMQTDHLTDTPPLTFPFVVKEAAGRGGKQVYFIQTKKDWEQCLNRLTTQDLVIQSANVQLGKDVRVFVVGKEIVGAVLRESKTDFRANFKLGGTATWYTLNDKEKALIQKIIGHMDFDMVGIDFLIDLDGGFLFNEIEDVVGSRILSATSHINILEKYVRHIKNKLGMSVI